jgi:hypothetical protein
MSESKGAKRKRDEDPRQAIKFRDLEELRRDISDLIADLYSIAHDERDPSDSGFIEGMGYLCDARTSCPQDGSQPTSNPLADLCAGLRVLRDKFAVGDSRIEALLDGMEIKCFNMHYLA